MSEELKDSFIIRPMEDGDFNFVINSWLKSYRLGSTFTKRIRNNVYYDFHHKVIGRILERGASILVAADKIDPTVIMGYLVVENYNGTPLVHYCYTKSAFRRLGIAKSLVEASTIDLNSSVFSHWTAPMDEIIKKYSGLVYNPYLL